jgi:hypothetical protein
MSKILNDNITQQASPTQTEKDDFTGSLENLGDPLQQSPYLGRVMEYGSRASNVGRRRRGQVRSSNSLEVLPAEPHVSYTARYKRSGTGNVYNIDIAGFAKTVVASSATTTYRPCIRAFRIKEITVPGSTGAVGDSASVGLRYLGTNTNETLHIDDTMKIDVNAMVTRKPPRFSLASFWHDVVSEDINTPLVTVQYFGTGEFYVDVQLEFIIDVNRYVNYSLSGAVGLVTGGIYRGDLTAGLEPVGVAST